MNIYVIRQDINKEFDAIHTAIVVAKDEHEARLIDPFTQNVFGSKPLSRDDWAAGRVDGGRNSWGVWAWDPADVQVQLVGVAIKDAYTVPCSLAASTY